MEKNYERQNEQLRRNIELLEQGITVKKYLQIYFKRMSRKKRRIFKKIYGRLYT